MPAANKGPTNSEYNNSRSADIDAGGCWFCTADAAAAVVAAVAIATAVASGCCSVLSFLPVACLIWWLLSRFFILVLGICVVAVAAASF